jgi:uncharacterized membrane protein
VLLLTFDRVPRGHSGGFEVAGEVGALVAQEMVLGAQRITAETEESNYMRGNW